VILLAFAAYIAVWVAHYSIQISPSVNGKLRYNDDFNNEFVRNYRYSCEESGVTYIVYVPHFLSFWGNVFVTEPIRYDEDGEVEDEYVMGFTYIPRLFQDNVLNFTIIDQTCETKMFFHVNIWTDSELNLIEENVVGAYDMFIDDMRVFYEEHVLTFFDEELFR
jgi:hypothetical protein